MSSLIIPKRVCLPVAFQYMTALWQRFVDNNINNNNYIVLYRFFFFYNIINIRFREHCIRQYDKLILFCFSLKISKWTGYILFWPCFSSRFWSKYRYVIRILYRAMTLIHKTDIVSEMTIRTRYKSLVGPRSRRHRSAERHPSINKRRSRRLVGFKK